MSWNKNPYYSPEEFGLTKVAEMELAEPDYSFDILAAWKDAEGHYFMGTDSGCSCPTPFEDYDSTADMTGPLTSEQVITEAASLARTAYQSEYALKELPAFVAAIASSMVVS